MLVNRSIQKVEIKNFQSHHHTVLELADGINLITGTSNSGKSAINRAINWAISNKPRGDYFIRWNATYSSVHITFYDGAELIRLRGIEENYVKIKYPNEDKFSAYEKFGAEYPEPVKKFLSIPRDNEIIGNIFYAEQMAPLFLLNLSSTELPKAIGYLAGSDVMEKASNLMLKESRQNKKDQSKILSELSKTEKELKKYSNLDSQFVLLNQIQDKKEILINKKNKLSEIEELESKIISCNDKIENNKNHIENLSKFTGLSHISKTLNEKISIYDRFNSFYSNYSFFNKSYLDVSRKIKHHDKFFNEHEQDSLASIKNKIHQFYSVDNLSKDFNKISVQINKIKSSINQIEDVIDDFSEKVSNMRNTLIEEGHICPTCGQQIK